MVRLIFSTILAMSVTGGIIILLISMLRPVTARTFSAAWNYYVNLIVLIFLLIPIGFIPGKVFVDIPPGFVVQATETDSVAWDDMQEVTAITGNELIQADQQTKFTFHLDDILYYLFWIWLLGMLICISHKGKQFLIFKRNLLETSSPVEQGSCAFQVYQECRSNLRIKQKIRLLCNDSIKTPMVTGLFNCSLIIPEVDMDKSELGFILRHELIHCKRKDLWFKAVAWFANAVHWFNPLVYKMVYDIDEFCEISCDEAVVKDMSMQDRHLYGETILNVLSRVITKQEGICSNFCESEKGLKRRLMCIMEKKSFPHKITAASIAILIVMCIAGSALAYMLVPSDDNRAGDSEWETILKELDSKALFEDIVADQNLDLKNTAEFESALEQLLNIIAQKHKSTAEEQTIEALMVPVPNGKITSPYGYRVHPITQEHKLHTGIDYAQKAGADIVAANGGKVIATQDDLGSTGYGNYLIIVHKDGTACLYAHCSTLIANTGDWVNKGDKIAEIGCTGNATGPHCHFEFRINGKAVDPTPHIAVTE